MVTKAGENSLTSDFKCPRPNCNPRCNQSHKPAAYPVLRLTTTERYTYEVRPADPIDGELDHLYDANSIRVRHAVHARVQHVHRMEETARRVRRPAGHQRQRASCAPIQVVEHLSVGFGHRESGSDSSGSLPRRVHHHSRPVLSDDVVLADVVRVAVGDKLDRRNAPLRGRECGVHAADNAAAPIAAQLLKKLHGRSVGARRITRHARSGSIGFGVCEFGAEVVLKAGVDTRTVRSRRLKAPKRVR
mmetsp:Transcript_47312/g.106691  ORF Transcript_47312/g.106691 Transcript_47312/m.106691 type:complete len:246 (-) Transcript_47312:384-1121(-)